LARRHVDQNIKAELLKLHILCRWDEEGGVVSIEEITESPDADVNAWLLGHVFQYPVDCYREEG